LRRYAEAAAHPLDRLCPTGIGGVPSTDVIAVFPFDEAPIAATSTVGRCRLPVSNPVLKAPTVSALETRIS